MVDTPEFSHGEERVGKKMGCREFRSFSGAMPRGFAERICSEDFLQPSGLLGRLGSSLSKPLSLQRGSL